MSDLSFLTASPSFPPSTDMLGDVGCALALRDELLAAGQTLSDEFNSRLAGMLRSHGHTSESFSQTSMSHTVIPSFQQHRMQTSNKLITIIIIIVALYKLGRKDVTY